MKPDNHVFMFRANIDLLKSELMKNIQNMKRLLSLTVSQLLAKDQLGNTGYTY
jgi:hypothetical protein